MPRIYANPSQIPVKQVILYIKDNEIYLKNIFQ